MDPEQTAPTGAVWSGSTLTKTFQQTIKCKTYNSTSYCNTSSCWCHICEQSWLSWLLRHGSRLLRRWMGWHRGSWCWSAEIYIACMYNVSLIQLKKSKLYTCFFGGEGVNDTGSWLQLIFIHKLKYQHYAIDAFFWGWHQDLSTREQWCSPRWTSLSRVD